MKKETPVIKGHLLTIKNGTKHDFLYEYRRIYHEYLNAEVYTFKIWIEGDGVEDIYRFSYMLRIMENGVDLKVVDLYANHYAGMGISKAIILKSKVLFNKRIISSSDKVRSYDGESNREDAREKVWKSLVRDGLAEYDAKEDYYFLL
jgi:hypothetical protein